MAADEIQSQEQPSQKNLECRSWFTSLSAEEMVQATAIHDPTFIRMFLKLSKRSEARGMSRMEEGTNGALAKPMNHPRSTASVPLSFHRNKVRQLYEQAIPKHLKDAGGISVITSQAEGPKRIQKQDGVTVEVIEEGDFQMEIETTNERNIVEPVGSVHTLQSSKLESLEDAERVVINSKIAASKAMQKNSKSGATAGKVVSDVYKMDQSKSVSAASRLQRYARLTSLVYLGNEASSQDAADTIVFDSSFLKSDNGKALLNVAGAILQEKRKVGFLLNPPTCSRDELKSGIVCIESWPQWLAFCCNTFFKEDTNLEDEDYKIPIHFLLLARVEMSIWGAFWRHVDGQSSSNVKEFQFIDKLQAISELIEKAQLFKKYACHIGAERCTELMRPLTANLSLAEEVGDYGDGDANSLDRLLLAPIPWVLAFGKDYPGWKLMQQVESTILNLSPETLAGVAKTKSKKKSKKKKSKKKSLQIVDAKDSEQSASRNTCGIRHCNSSSSKSNKENGGDISVQRMKNGISVTVVPVAPSVNNLSSDNTPDQVSHKTHDDSNDGWEQVEKPRGKKSRKLKSNSTDASTSNTSSNSRKKKNSKNNKRRNSKKEKESLVKDVLNSILNKVEKEVKKVLLDEKRVPSKPSSENKRVSPPPSNTLPTVPKSTIKNKTDVTEKPMTLSTPKTGAVDYSIGGTAATAPETISGMSFDKDAEMPQLSDPPLPRLLSGPENTSGSSSVASSLEGTQEPTTSDVGYHLLDICNRLSQDMETFMRRRALALSVRRRERGVLLASLQESVAKIWSGRGHVKMYGSCATELDLPSSDLDVVICGLGGNPKKKKGAIDTSNVGRVYKLAEELENQPWAIQVKPIPTATVPVVKLLADPSRLPGAAQIGEWNRQLTAQTDCGMHSVPSSMTQGMPMIMPHHWRGADVMNGLMSVDITFEGPEHGGVWSTAYAANFVVEACNEARLPPEMTPAVQLVMVLKELLAQKRLNEPFSGGLSSYGVLLMVAAVLQESRALRAQLKEAERQKRKVASASRPTAPVPSKNAVFPSSESKNKKTLHKSSSWASVAKGPKSKKESEGLTQASLSDESRSSSQVAEMSATPTPVVQGSSSIQSSMTTCEAVTTPVIIPTNDEVIIDSYIFQRESHDILEVLCSGEPTAGKLLMHFLLFYGQIFDAQAYALDVMNPRSCLIPRDIQPVIDPKTGMVSGGDFIVVFDPLEEANGGNVTRSCFAWPTIKWIFAQSYNTLTHTVEQKGRNENGKDVSPLLELLISY